MALFDSRPAIPLDAHEKALSEEIARLEKEIATLKRPSAKPERTAQFPPTIRSASAPEPSLRPESSPPEAVKSPKRVASSSSSVQPLPLPPSIPPGLKVQSPTLDLARSAPTPAIGSVETPIDPRFNELGVRKFDLGSWWRARVSRLRQHTMGPTSNNPHMIKYLATGSVQGLRPLRYERRVARNRLLALVATLVVVLYGLAWVFLRGSQR